MRMRILPFAALAAAFTLPAVAAPSSSSQSSPAPGASTQSNTPNQTPRIAAKLSQSLTQAGFSDVHVLPESFLVRAKDRDGNPVMMVINPELNDRGHGDGPLVERRRNLEWEPFQRWCDIGFTKCDHAPVESAAAERAGSVPGALRGAGGPGRDSQASPRNPVKAECLVEVFGKRQDCRVGHRARWRRTSPQSM